MADQLLKSISRLFPGGYGGGRLGEAGDMSGGADYVVSSRSSLDSKTWPSQKNSIYTIDEAVEKMGFGISSGW